MNALTQRVAEPEPRDEARDEARTILRGFRGALSSMAITVRARIAGVTETETVGNLDSLGPNRDPARR
jgi:hypothetical protein